MFRSLSTQEADLAFDQVGFDARAGKLMGAGEYHIWLAHYRLAMSLHQILDARGGIIKENPPISHVEVEQDPTKDETPLAAFLPWFYQNILLRNPCEGSPGNASTNSNGSWKPWSANPASGF